MNAWYEAAVVTLIALAGLLLGGLAFNRTYRTAVAGSVISVGIIALLLLAHCLHVWTIYGGLDWIAAARLKYILIIFAICLGFTSPLGYLRRTWKWPLMCFVLPIFIALFIGLPFYGPAVMLPEIRSLPTRLDERGLCYQSRPYTCGPAAAVTALVSLGLPASESAIADAARTAPMLGTCPWDLYRALDRLYAPQGVVCRYGRYESIDDLPQHVRALAVMREGIWTDHCVAVLDADESSVLVGDPSEGLRRVSRLDFELAWRGTAITLEHTGFSIAR